MTFNNLAVNVEISICSIFTALLLQRAQTRFRHMKLWFWDVQSVVVSFVVFFYTITGMIPTGIKKKRVVQQYVVGTCSYILKKNILNGRHTLKMGTVT